MGNGNTGNVSRLVAAVDAFNEAGDFGPLLALLDDDVVWLGLEPGKAAVAAALEQAHADGWVRHDMTSISAEPPFIAITARNTGSDGSTWTVAGCYAFDGAGNIVQIASLDASAL